MISAAVAEALWRLNIELLGEVSFPSIVIRDIYTRLNTSVDFALLQIDPDIFPGEGRTEEAIDTIYKYEIIIKGPSDSKDVKASLKRAFKGIKGLGRIALSVSAGPEISENAAPQKAAVDPEQTVLRGRDHGSMRVDLVKIEDLVNLIGELIINKNQVDALSHAILQKTPADAETKNSITDFQSAKNQLNYVTSKLRDLALGIRMIPIGQTLRKFPAAVREMARKNGKRIRVLVEGEDTELDKAILEEISDPLLHMIRNAVDHGIEFPEERERKGKKAEGTILIRAEHEGDRISIFVEDDGAGLRLEKIKAKAVSQRIISAAEAERMPEREAFHLIFSPGFSTADSVSDLSGRGVGMDVVKSNINRLNGIVDVESGADAGTRVTLKLPLTLSILEGLLLEDNGQIYAIPLIAIEKASLIEAGSLKRLGRYWLTEKGGQTLPVFRIAELFGSVAEDEGSSFYLVEASVAGGRFGLLVQKILGRQEIVLKPLGDYLGTVTGISGSTILGNGRVALILDTKTIADSVKTILDEDQSRLMTAGSAHGG